VPRRAPPDQCPGPLRFITIRRGTRLWRVHAAHRAATTMNSTPHPHASSGGRFDSLDGSCAYLYAGGSIQAAVAETLTRDLPLDGTPRLLPRSALAHRRLSELQVNRALRLVALHGPGLAAVGQDTWLTKCEARDYPLTRRWAAAIRRWAPQAVGFVYRCRHDEDEFAYVFFAPPDVSECPFLSATGTRVDLDTPVGHLLVRAVLTRYHATLARDW